MEIDATKAFALQALSIQENDFLLSFGWLFVGDGNWKPPPGYLKRKRIKAGDEPFYDKSHAINSQKWTNKNL